MDFEDDIDYTTAIACVFDDSTLPSIESDLRDHGATRSGGTCSECDGVLYDYEHEVICENCSLVISADTSSSRDRTSHWTHFKNSRPTYNNSKQKRCVGGFPHVYSWVKSEDIDQPISSVDPNSFYR